MPVATLLHGGHAGGEPVFSWPALVGALALWVVVGGVLYWYYTSRLEGS